MTQALFYYSRLIIDKSKADFFTQIILNNQMMKRW